MMLDRLKAEFHKNASSDPMYYFNPRWFNMLEYYMNLAYTLGYEARIEDDTHHGRRPCMGINDEGKKIEFNSVREASRKTGINHPNIVRSIQTFGRLKAGGYKWTYTNEETL